MADIATKYWLILAAFGLLLAAVIGTRGKRKNKQKRSKNLKIAPKAKAHGIIFGLIGRKKVMYSPVSGEEHVLTCAGTGQGKTSSILIPTLRSWEGSSLSIDISGDISKNCPDMENKLIYEPESPETIPYNVFAAIDAMSGDKDKQDEMLEELAILLIPESPNISSNAKFFADNGRKILTGVLIYGYHKGTDFCKICKNLVSTAWQDMFEEILKGNDEKAKMYIASFSGSNEQNTAGCYQNAADAVALFATNKNVYQSVRRPAEGEKAVTPPLIENSNIFLIIQDEKLELFAPLLNIIVAQFMQYISSRTVKEDSKKILLTLDEFASLGIDSQTILAALRKYRKKLCRVMVLTQSVADITLLYGDDCTRALLANFRFKILLGGLGDLESLEMFARLIGYRKVTKRSISHSSRDTSRTESEEKEYIIEPAELDRMGDKVILISEDGHYILRKNFYYKNG